MGLDCGPRAPPAKYMRVIAHPNRPATKGVRSPQFLESIAPMRIVALICGVDPLIRNSQPASDPPRGGGKRPRAICKCGPHQNIRSVSRPRSPSVHFHHLQFARQPSEPSMEALEELKQKTRGLRRGLMATTVIVDASVAVCNEWVSVVTDYVGPQLNHIAGKFLDHQVHGTWSSRLAYVLICARSFSSGALS